MSSVACKLQYLEIARGIDCLYGSGDLNERKDYLRSIRKLWVFGTDDVIKAANALSNDIKVGESPETLEKRHGDLFNAMRHDIRRIEALPPTNTELSASHFPVLGAGK